MAAAIEIQNLTVGSGDRMTIGGIDLVVPAGPTVGLLGNSGAGKTTLLRTVAGPLRRSGGRVAVDGAAGRRAALAFGPHAGLTWPVPVRLVDDTLAGVWPGFSADRLHALTERLGLPADRPVRPLSTAQAARQRLAYALRRPGSLPVPDAPPADVDPARRGRIAQILAKPLARTGPTTLVATGEVSRLAAPLERVVLLRDGKAACDERVKEPRRRTGTSVETCLRKERAA